RLAELLAGVVEHGEGDLTRLDEAQPLPGLLLDVVLVLPTGQLGLDPVDLGLLGGDLLLGPGDGSTLIEVTPQRRSQEQRQETEQDDQRAQPPQVWWRLTPAGPVGRGAGRALRAAGSWWPRRGPLPARAPGARSARAAS